MLRRGDYDELASRIEEARMLVLMLPIDADRQRLYLAGVAEGQARHAFRLRDYPRVIERAKDSRKLTDEPSARCSCFRVMRTPRSATTRPRTPPGSRCSRPRTPSRATRSRRASD